MTNERPKLYGTPLSHFTRKLRILFAELGEPYEYVRPTGVMGTQASTYADNPLLRIPTLVHRGHTIIESDHIARYIVGTYDPDDRFGVRSERVEDMNQLAVVNGIMANEVTLILAKRGGLAELDSVAYFRKLLTATEAGLAWLDAHMPDHADERFDYRDIVTICMWQHVVHYKLVPGLERYPRIAARVDHLATRASVAGTAPEVSLAEAQAAGWKPA